MVLVKEKQRIQVLPFNNHFIFKQNRTTRKYNSPQTTKLLKKLYYLGWKEPAN